MTHPTVHVMLVGVDFPEGEHIGRLLDEVPRDYRSKFPQPDFGGWTKITLNGDQAAEVSEVGSPVAVLNVKSMEVVGIVHQDTCREKILRLPTSAED